MRGRRPTARPAAPAGVADVPLCSSLGRMIGDELERVPAAARRARGAAQQHGRPVRALRACRGGRRLGHRGGDAAAAHRGGDRAAAHDHHPQPARPTSRSTARSTPIAAASTAASIASPARATPILGLSPGLDFETRLTAKPRRGEGAGGRAVAPRLPAGADRDRHQHRPLPADREAARDHARQVLEVLRDFRHPVTVLTKGALIERDADILGEMGRGGAGAWRAVGDDARPQARPGDGAAGGGAGAAAGGDPAAGRGGLPGRGCSIGAGDPGAQRPRDRARCSRRRADAGAGAAGYVVLRLPREVGPLFRDWLDEALSRPGEAGDGLVRELHGGRDYDPAWGRRMKGEGVHRRADRPPLRRRARRGSASTATCRRSAPTSSGCRATGPEQLTLF